MTKSERGLLIAARVLYIAMSLMILRRVQLFLLVNIRFIKSDTFPVVLDAAFTVFFIVMMALQFAYVFLNKQGKINTAIALFVMAIIFNVYSSFNLTRTIIQFMDMVGGTSKINLHLILTSGFSFFMWVVILAYSIVMFVLSRRRAG